MLRGDGIESGLRGVILPRQALQPLQFATEIVQAGLVADLAGGQLSHPQA